MSTAPAVDYIAKKLTNAQKIVKVLSAVQAHLAASLFKPVENSVLGLLKSTEIWHQDELVCALDCSDFNHCVEQMLCICADDYGRDDKTHDVMAAMYEVVLDACPLTEPTRNKLLAAERLFSKQEERRERVEAQKPCGCWYGQWCRECQDDYDGEENDDTDDDEDDGASSTLLKNTLDELPLVRKLFLEFGGH